jgi:hypothetical protein
MLHATGETGVGGCPGDPHDFEYAGEFLRAFGQSVSLGQFKKVNAVRAENAG